MKLDASRPTSSARLTSIGSVRSVVSAMCSVVAVSCRIGRVNRPASHHPTSAAIAVAIAPIAIEPVAEPVERVVDLGAVPRDLDRSEVRREREHPVVVAAHRDLAHDRLVRARCDRLVLDVDGERDADGREDGALAVEDLDGVGPDAPVVVALGWAPHEEVPRGGARLTTQRVVDAPEDLAPGRHPCGCRQRDDDGGDEEREHEREAPPEAHGARSV